MKKNIIFNMRELSGSMGDFGTLFPLAVGYIAIVGLDPAGLLIMMGVANIATGLFYGLPLPIEPMKILAVTAIAQRWTPDMVYASGFCMGIIWLLIGTTGFISVIAKIVPKSVVRGIQISLGFLLAKEALYMMSPWWLLGLIALVVIYLFKDNPYLPSAVILMAGGIIIMAITKQLPEFSGIRIHLPGLSLFGIKDMWTTMILGGFAQIPMTTTNAVIATAALIKTYWPESNVSEKQLALNMGVMNLVLPFFGSMPLCHGAGGLAGQYSFGARTGGTNVIEGTIEILLGLFLATSIAVLFANFPAYIIGAMMVFVGIELVKMGRHLSGWQSITVASVTVILSLLLNVAVGFAAGITLDRFWVIFINKDNHSR